MSEVNTFGKQLLLNIIPLFLGSFVFIGVIENYKNDSELKIKLLEDYFKPSRELVADCHSKHNDLFLKYPSPPAQLRLFSEEMVHLMNNPSLKGNRDYDLILEALAKTYQESTKELKDLEILVKECRVDVFRSLETLSIAAGAFEEFAELSKEHSRKLNSIYKSRSKESKENTGGVGIDDLKGIMRSIATINFESKEGQEKFKLQMNSMLPVIEKHAEIMSRTEQEIFDADNEFYSKVRIETSARISDLFKEDFFGWIF